MLFIWLVALIVVSICIACWLGFRDRGTTLFRIRQWWYLIPIRFTLCMISIVHPILIELTDAWGNARLQSLFPSILETHNAPESNKYDVVDDETSSSSNDDTDGASVSSHISASRVPLSTQFQELVDIFLRGLDGPSNLLHTLHSTTYLLFVDSSGLIVDTCRSVQELCVWPTSSPLVSTETINSVISGFTDPPDPNNAWADPTPQERSERNSADTHSEVAGGLRPVSREARHSLDGDALLRDTQRENPLVENVHLSSHGPLVLDVRENPQVEEGVEFEEVEKAPLNLLRPLALAMALTQGWMRLDKRAGDSNPSQPAESNSHSTLERLSFREALEVIDSRGRSAVKDCSCSPAVLCGYNDQFLSSWKSERTVLAYSASQSTPHRGDGDEAANRMPPENASNRFNPEDSFHMMWLYREPTTNKMHLFTKAHPSVLLPYCKNIFNGSKIVPFNPDDSLKFRTLVLQWRSSGLFSFAYACRPLTDAQAHILLDHLEEVNISLIVSNFMFEKRNLPDHSPQPNPGDMEWVAKWRPQSTTAIANRYPPTVWRCMTRLSGKQPPNHDKVERLLRNLHSQQILLGMAAYAMTAPQEVAFRIKDFHQAGVRVSLFSQAGPKETRVIGSLMGLETGWNCLISLQPTEKEDMHVNMDGKVVLPSGIQDIKTHLEETDDVPLHVSLFCNGTKQTKLEMIEILKKHGEIVTCVGSAYKPSNFDLFEAAHCAVSTLIAPDSECRRCFGRRQHGSLALMNSTMLLKEFDVSAAFTSLPCALQARMTQKAANPQFINELLYESFKEARRMVGSIQQSLLFYVCGASFLASTLFLQGAVGLPPLIEGLPYLFLLLVDLPLLAASLLANPATDHTMQEYPLKSNQAKELKASTNKLFLHFAIRVIPNACFFVVLCLAHLHVSLESFLSNYALTHPDDSAEKDAALHVCVDTLYFYKWFTGGWIQCFELLDTVIAAQDGPHNAWLPIYHSHIYSLVVAVIVLIIMSMSFVDRYESLRTVPPWRNKILLITCGVLLVVHAAVAALHLVFLGSWVVPSLRVWPIMVGTIVWFCLIVVADEFVKARDRRDHQEHQSILGIFFNTRLGMWSPR
eukprot:GHVN01068989.1.p1 GENE.GHVN01068989.1~~GHVN01068989.1.p1  ORF type:complete len:1092 (+),score=122.62 GHVN01068989.1:819-4094(+)